MRHATNADGLAAWAACLGPFGLYLATLTPGVAFWDIGEMQTVPYLLGIAHPTGFPLVVLAGWVVTHALPVGDPAWRMSAFCAFAASAAALALFAFVRDVTGDAGVAVASALAFAVGDVVWEHAVRADVHDVALAAIAASLAFAFRAGETGSPRALAVAALTCGAGIAAHPIAALALPCAVAFAWPALRAVGPRALSATAALGALPLAAYAYVPLRSAYAEAHGGDPGRELGLVGTAFFDPGAPSTPGAFWRYVTGAEFSPVRAFVRAGTTHGIATTLAFAREIAYRNDGYAMLALALVGFAVASAKRPRVGIGFATVALATLGFVANFPAESDLARYALPALWALGACAGVGAHALARAFAGDAPRSRARAATVATAALLVALIPNVVAAARHVGETVRSNDARALGPTIARATVDGSLLVASWNFATPLAYETYVAHALGTRRLAVGWPHDFPGRYAAWHARYGHVYFVLARAYDVTPFANPIVASGRWQLSELR